MVNDFGLFRPLLVSLKTFIDLEIKNQSNPGKGEVKSDGLTARCLFITPDPLAFILNRALLTLTSFHAEIWEVHGLRILYNPELSQVTVDLSVIQPDCCWAYPTPCNDKGVLAQWNGGLRR